MIHCEAYQLQSQLAEAVLHSQVIGVVNREWRMVSGEWRMVSREPGSTWQELQPSMFDH